MRNAPNLKIERYRTSGPPRTNCGFFILTRRGEPDLRFMLSEGMGWDHVSVSTECRCPTWEEMCHVKELVFRDDEVVMQLHPAKKDYINQHPYCLHLWRPQTATEMDLIRLEWERDGEYMETVETPGPIPMPPKIAVGLTDAQIAEANAMLLDTPAPLA